MKMSKELYGRKYFLQCYHLFKNCNLLEVRQNALLLYGYQVNDFKKILSYSACVILEQCCHFNVYNVVNYLLQCNK